MAKKVTKKVDVQEKSQIELAEQQLFYSNGGTELAEEARVRYTEADEALGDQIDNMMSALVEAQKQLRKIKGSSPEEIEAWVKALQGAAWGFANDISHIGSIMIFDRKSERGHTDYSVRAYDKAMTMLENQ